MTSVIWRLRSNDSVIASLVFKYFRITKICNICDPLNMLSMDHWISRQLFKGNAVCRHRKTLSLLALFLIVYMTRIQQIELVIFHDSTTRETTILIIAFTWC